jgi:hypothetical protein
MWFLMRGLIWFLMRGLRFLMFLILLLLGWVLLEEAREWLRRYFYEQGPGAAQ